MSIQDERLYYHDSYLDSFEASVIRQQMKDGHWHISLNQTAFYPTSGGQPYDTGVLGGYVVEAVYIDDDDHVIHVIPVSEAETEPPFAIGETVVGTINWSRRFDHMQHHTGQHILSACFERELNLDTVGFHLGTEDVTVDIAGSELPSKMIADMEWKTNQVIWSNLPVSARFIETSELVNLKLRRPPKLSENIRIVTIDTFDNNACGGTHVGSTAEVGLLKILKTDRIRQGTRIHFRCGGRALKDYEVRSNTLVETANRLSVAITDVPANVASMEAALKAGRKQEQYLREKLIQLTARDYAGHAAASVSGLRYVCAKATTVENAGELKALATAILSLLSAQNESCTVALIYEDDHRAHLVVASSPSSVVHAGQMVDKILTFVDGKGGGKQQYGQGSVPLPKKGFSGSLLNMVEESLAATAATI